MISLKTFRETNDLKQAEVASYIGVTKSFISQVENGVRLLPPSSLYKLINNDQGWDSSMLDEKDNVILPQTNKDILTPGTFRARHSEDDYDMLKSKLEILQREIADKDNTIADLKIQLEKQTRWIDKLLKCDD